MSEASEPESEILLYQTEDGRVRIDVRFEGETAWLTQASIARLYQTTPQNITMHIAAVYEEGELSEEATCKDYLQVRQEGARRVRRSLKHYSLPVVLAVGYRVRSSLGTLFRKWATARLEEYVRKGFTLDDARLKNPSGPGSPDYFDELLERIRDIRSSEKIFWKKVLEIYATSIDYDPSDEATQRFFATVQKQDALGCSWPYGRGSHRGPSRCVQAEHGVDIILGSGNSRMTVMTCSSSTVRVSLMARTNSATFRPS